LGEAIFHSSVQNGRGIKVVLQSLNKTWGGWGEEVLIFKCALLIRLVEKMKLRTELSD